MSVCIPTAIHPGASRSKETVFLNFCVLYFRTAASVAAAIMCVLIHYTCLPDLLAFVPTGYQ